VKIEPEKKGRLLAPLADAYGPTQAQADRLFGKLQASIAEGLDGASSSNEASPASPSRVAVAWGGKSLLFVGLSCMALATTGALVLREWPRASDAGVTTMTVAASATPRPVEVVPVAEGSETTPSISVNALPTVAIVHSSENDMRKVAVPTPASISSSERAPSPGDNLAREARLLSDARRALKSGDGAGALALLDEHARVFPGGALANERVAERVVVLCSLGRRADAAREGAIFLDGRPKGALTRRVEMSCAGQPGSEVEQ
jgi:hypothetical protein